jgi:hypothetical protein
LTQFSSAGSIMLCADDAIFVPVLQAWHTPVTLKFSIIIFLHILTFVKCWQQWISLVRLSSSLCNLLKSSSNCESNVSFDAHAWENYGSKKLVTDQFCSSSNTFNSYSGGAQFASQPGYPVSQLRFFRFSSVHYSLPSYHLTWYSVICGLTP